MQTRSQSTAVNSNSRRVQQQSFTGNGIQSNKYLFFITDKFVAEKNIENEEKMKLKRKLDIERLEEAHRIAGNKRLRTSSTDPDQDQARPSGSKPRRTTAANTVQNSKDAAKAGLHPMEFGFMTSSTKESSSEVNNLVNTVPPASSSKQTSIDDELAALEQIFEDTQNQIQFDLN